MKVVRNLTGYPLPPKPIILFSYELHRKVDKNTFVEIYEKMVKTKWPRSYVKRASQRKPLLNEESYTITYCSLFLCFRKSHSSNGRLYSVQCQSDAQIQTR